MTRLIHSRWMGSSAAGSPISAMPSTTASSAAFPATRYTTVLRMFSWIARPSRIPSMIEAKWSSASTMEAASRVTSVPVMPIAMPTWASRIAGASLTPSPVLATTRPSRARSRTVFSLSSGVTRARMSSTPSSRAMARAVVG